MSSPNDAAHPVCMEVLLHSSDERSSDGSHASATHRMAHRILDASEHPFDRHLESVGLRMLRCAMRRTRCGHVLCPRDAVQIAKRNNRRVTERIGSVARGVKFAHITLTTGADDIPSGHATLFDSFAALRRKKVWRGIIGGYANGEVLPAIGGSRVWNIHLHVLGEIGGEIDVPAIRRAWSELLAKHDKPAGVTVTRVARRFVAGRRGDRFLAARLLHDEAAPSAGLARRHRRTTAGARERLRRPPVGRVVRDMVSAFQRVNAD